MFFVGHKLIYIPLWLDSDKVAAQTAMQEMYLHSTVVRFRLSMSAYSMSSISIYIPLWLDSDWFYFVVSVDFWYIYIPLWLDSDGDYLDEIPLWDRIYIPL